MRTRWASITRSSDTVSTIRTLRRDSTISRAEYYDPEVGRFVNADGYINGNGDLLGFNMYAYCGNNPVMYTDPSGEGKIWDWIKTLLKT